MKYKATLFVAIAVGMISVRATPISATEVNPLKLEITPFLVCIRQKYPAFPDGDMPTDEELSDCTQASSLQSKRDEQDSPFALRPTEPIPNEEESSDNAIILARTPGPSVQKLGQTLGLSEKAYCPYGGVHNEFMWAKDIKDMSRAVCNELRTTIKSKGVTGDGGIASTKKSLSNANNKKGNRMAGHKDITATFTLEIMTQPGKSLDDIRAIAEGVYDLCSDGISQIAYKDGGCGEEQRWYQATKVRFAKDIGAAGGELTMFWGDPNYIAGRVTMVFSDDD